MAHAVGPNMQVTVHYKLRDARGNLLEDTEADDSDGPVKFIVGMSMVLPGLEKGLEGAYAGDVINLVVAPEDGYGTRDETDVFDVERDTQKSIAFGAGPHYCAGAFASRAIVASVALPTIFARLRDLRLDEAAEPVRFGGWAFRGPLNLPARWSV